MPTSFGTRSVPGSPQAQVLRNQSVGSTCRVSSVSPRFATVITTHMSVGDALA